MCFFFFFKQKTAYEMRISDWSSDVCSSDLPRSGAPTIQVEMTRHTPTQDSRTLVRSFTGKKADDVGAILAQAVGVLAAQAEEDWKRETLLQFQGQQRMQVSVPLRQLGDSEIGRAECRERGVRYV